MLADLTDPGKVAVLLLTVATADRLVATLPINVFKRSTSADRKSQRKTVVG
jgi:hypothetical protein